MSGAYEPREVESRIYQSWEAGGHFHAVADPARRPFTIVIPPPNITGALHLGHALNNTLQDILIRRKRMQGYNACWLPGTDHASIATQAVVEKRLREEQKLTRHQIGREALLKKIWDWKEEYNERILMQLRKMGCSCDWQRTRFTLDEMCGRAVYTMFFRFFREGLIYRGLRLVNWDTQLQTAVADDEVYHEAVRGHLWHVRYPLAGIKGLRDLGIEGASGSDLNPSNPQSLNPSQYLTVATTRPETMLADTAVAVHPEDERFRHLIGRRVILPLTGRAIPVVADGMLVKREFGTGAVKVTPGHDPNDYACWQRKKGQPDAIEIRNMMTPDGRVDRANSGDGEKYAGLKLDEARKRVVADLEAAGLLEKVEPYETDVGHSDRSKTQIQPFLSEQWFVRMESLAETAMEAVRDGRVRFFPERYAKTYLDWLGEKRDWCISRQLWWGHRIPVWTRRLSWSEYESLAAQDVDALVLTAQKLENVSVRVTCADGSTHCVSGAPGRAEYDAFHATLDPGERLYWQVCLDQPDAHPWMRERLEQRWGFEQDPDVLDTWFSSALWPHSTFGWPGGQGLRDSGIAVLSDAPAPALNPLIPQSLNPSDLAYFYPTSVLSTAREIITLWVARMVMTGLYNTGRVPFQHVYIHAVIQDGQGRRMSKSAGNGVDPLDIIDAYGADALRFTLAQLATETQDIRIPVKPTQLADGRTVNSSERFELGRNLVTKLWQAATGFVIPTCRDAVIRTQNDECGMQNQSEASASGRGDEESGDSRPPDVERRSTLDLRPLRSTAAGAPVTCHLSPAHRHTSRRPADMPLFEKWIRVKLLACIREVDRRLENYEFAAAVDAVRSFFWYELCDWYIEEVKSHLRATATPGVSEQALAAEKNDVKLVLLQVFDVVLGLFHPVIPFVSEAIWQEIGREIPHHHELIWPDDEPLPETPPPLIAAPWPRAAAAAGRPLADAAWLIEVDAQKDAEREVDSFLSVIRSLREIRTSINAIRSQSKQPALRMLPGAVVRGDAPTAALLRQGEATIYRLGQVEPGGLTISADAAKPPQALSRILSGIEVYVPIAGLADLDVERRRLAKEREDVSGHLARLEGKLANESFVAKAPAAVIEQERARLSELREKLAAIEAHVSELG
ncbi:MAG: valine--tRNA ligase [Phycisphaerae bacterium]